MAISTKKRIALTTALAVVMLALTITLLLKGDDIGLEAKALPIMKPAKGTLSVSETDPISKRPVTLQFLQLAPAPLTSKKVGPLPLVCPPPNPWPLTFDLDYETDYAVNAEVAAERELKCLKKEKEEEEVEVTPTEVSVFLKPRVKKFEGQPFVPFQVKQSEVKKPGRKVAEKEDEDEVKGEPLTFYYHPSFIGMFIAAIILGCYHGLPRCGHWYDKCYDCFCAEDIEGDSDGQPEQMEMSELRRTRVIRDNASPAAQAFMGPPRRVPGTSV